MRSMQTLGKAVAAVLVALIRVYQNLVSPLLGQHCRFYPSCSQYMVDAIRKKGPLLRCAYGREADLEVSSI